jgi:serine/alanine adding enzyme
MTVGAATSTVKVSAWAPGDRDRWSELVGRMPHANLAHAPEWFEAIRKGYGHTPLYLEAETAEGEAAVLPAFRVRSLLFGTVVTSMPFLDSGGPCGAGAPSRAAIDALLQEAQRRGAGAVELRSTVPLNVPVPPQEHKVNLVRALPKDAGELWSRLDARVRNQVRKAEKSGLSVEFGHLKALEAFYDVFAVNMRDLGSPVHGLAFFTAILESFGDKARVALVRKGPDVIGGLVALAFKDTLAVPWASSLREHFSLCPNVLMYWETLAAACREGFARFDFGRSSRDSGTYRFKRQWGAEEEPLYWYQLPIAAGQARSLSAEDSQGAALVALWKRLPVGVTRWLGPRVRRGLTQ